MNTSPTVHRQQGWLARSEAQRRALANENGRALWLTYRPPLGDASEWGTIVALPGWIRLLFFEGSRTPLAWACVLAGAVGAAMALGALGIEVGARLVLRRRTRRQSRA
jgi:hypothetical protein